jgi:hypothetical protein
MVGGGQTRGLEGCPSGRRAGVASQLQMGKAPPSFPGAFGCMERVMENGDNVEEVRTARLDGWIVWELRDREPD